MEFASSTRAAEARIRRKGIIGKSSVVPHLWCPNELIRLD